MQKFFTPRTLLVCFIAMLSTNSMGQVSIQNGGTYTQTFDNVPILAVAPLPTGFKANGTTGAQDVRLYSTAQTSTNFTAGANMSSTALDGIYNFGAGTTAAPNNSSDRAIGGFPSTNGSTSINLFLAMVNNGPSDILSFNISFAIEKYRNGTGVGSKLYGVGFYYSLTGLDGSWTRYAPFDISYTADNDDLGFSPAPKLGQTRNITNQNLVLPVLKKVVPGGTIYFAWCVSLAPGQSGSSVNNGQALGVDDIKIIGGTAAAFQPGDYYRSKTSGDWSLPGTWTSSQTGVDGSYVNAIAAPGAGSNLIEIYSGHVITVSTDVVTDETILYSGGTINITSLGKLRINDGPGFDLTLHGTLNNNLGGQFIILSGNEVKQSDVGTASVGRSDTLPTVTGPCTVQRFISAFYGKSAWRLLTAPLAATGSNTSIYDAWQNGGSLIPVGTGTRITGPVNNGGLDGITTYPSLKRFNKTTQLLEAVTQTNGATDPLFTTAATAANNAYFMYVDGDRFAGPQANDTTRLIPSGKLQFGPQSFDVILPGAPAGSIGLVGNPYACPIDLNTFRIENATLNNNLRSTYYYWDPYLAGSVGYGGYVTVSYDISGNLTISPADANHTAFLQSGQAMFVQSTATGLARATFNESQKIKNTANYVFRPTVAPEEIGINLNVTGNASPATVDGAVASFNENYSSAVDAEDATKMMNMGENISLIRNGSSLSIERRPTITSDDVLAIGLSNLSSTRTYQLEIKPSLTATGLPDAYLVDNYLKTATPLDLSSNTTVDFTINSDANSTGNNRFSITFTKPTFASAIAAATIGKRSITVYPNPVENGKINVKLNDMPAGIYSVKVLNNMGQTIATKVINHAAGSSTETIQARGLISGIYQLEVIKPDNSKFISKLLAK